MLLQRKQRKGLVQELKGAFVSANHSGQGLKFVDNLQFTQIPTHHLALTNASKATFNLEVY